MPTHVTDGCVGVDLTIVTTVPAYEQGQIVNLSDGGQAVYVKATSAIQQYDACVLYPDNSARPLTTSASALYKAVGFADEVSIGASSYGWLRLSGRPKVKLAANCADLVPLFSTATAGVLDDATVTQGFVTGMVSTVTISNATAVTCQGAVGTHTSTW
jgi:hypothetical protein